MKESLKGIVMLMRKWRVLSLLLAALLLPLFALSAGAEGVIEFEAEEVVIVSPVESGATAGSTGQSSGVQVEVLEHVAGEQTEQKTPSAPQDAHFRVTFHDLEGNELYRVSLKAGEPVQAPTFTPDRPGLVFQYWYDLFTYEQGTEPVPFAFGTHAARNYTLVPYYHYATGGLEGDQAGYGERMVEDVSDQLILDILMTDVHEGNAGITDIPSAMKENDAKTLIAEILKEEVTHHEATVPAENPVSVQSEEMVSQLISDVLSADSVQVIETPEGQMSETGSVQEQATSLLEAFFPDAFVSAETAPVETESATVMSKEQVSSLIEEMLAEGEIAALPLEPSIALPEQPEQMEPPAAETPSVPEVVMAEDAAGALIDDILSEPAAVPEVLPEMPEAPEAPAAVEPETAPAVIEPEAAAVQDADPEAFLMTPEDHIVVLGEQQTETSTDETDDAPRLEVVYSHTGELAPGTEVTVTAVLYNVDPNMTFAYQWENNADGEYRIVPGETGRSVTFIADESNTGCDWRVHVTAVEE